MHAPMHACVHACMHAHMHAHTHTHTHSICMKSWLLFESRKVLLLGEMRFLKRFGSGWGTGGKESHLLWDIPFLEEEAHVEVCLLVLIPGAWHDHIQTRGKFKPLHNLTSIGETAALSRSRTTLKEILFQRQWVAWRYLWRKKAFVNKWINLNVHAYKLQSSQTW